MELIQRDRRSGGAIEFNLWRWNSGRTVLFGCMTASVGPDRPRLPNGRCAVFALKRAKGRRAVANLAVITLAIPQGFIAN